MLLFDLAVPRDIEAEVGTLDDALSTFTERWRWTSTGYIANGSSTVSGAFP